MNVSITISKEDFKSEQQWQLRPRRGSEFGLLISDGYSSTSAPLTRKEVEKLRDALTAILNEERTPEYGSGNASNIRAVLIVRQQEEEPDR